MSRSNNTLSLGLFTLLTLSTPTCSNAGVSDYLPSGKQLAIGCAATVTLAGMYTKYKYNQWARSIPATPIEIEQESKSEPTCLPRFLQPAKPKITTVFAHGFGAYKNHGKMYANYEKGITSKQLCVFNFGDALCPEVDPTPRTCLGGADDVARLQKAVNSTTGKVELFGVSRGASTILRYLATAPKEETDRIVGAIVESPFGNYTDIVRNYPSRIRVATKSSLLARYMLHPLTYIIQGITKILPAPIPGSAISCIFPNADSLNNYPGSIVQQIPQSIPILFICSQEDILIPASSTKRMYDQLAKFRHNVELLEFEKGPHANIINFSGNKEKYLDALKKFREKYQTS